MQLDANEIRVENNQEKHRFEVKSGPHLAVAEYILAGDRIVFTHTEVPEALEGNGIGSRLAKTGLDYARDNGLRVMPLCPYIAAYIRKHPEYHSLVMEGFNI